MSNTEGLLREIKKEMRHDYDLSRAAQKLFEENWGDPNESIEDFKGRCATLLCREKQIESANRFRPRRTSSIQGGRRSKDPRIDPAADGYAPLPVDERMG